MDAIHTPPVESQKTRQSSAVPSPAEPNESFPQAKPRRSRATLGAHLERFALPLLLILIIAFFGILPASSSVFLSGANVSVVLANQSVITLVAIALVFPLVAGHFDFSVGGIAVLAAWSLRLPWRISHFRSGSPAFSVSPRLASSGQ